MCNLNTRSIISSILFLVIFNQLIAQDFYINQKSEVVNINYSISPQWVDLNINESYDFLSHSGFVDIKSTINGGKEIVSGRIQSKDYIYIRKLVFEEKIIKEYTDVILYKQPCSLCFANDMKLKLNDNPTMQDIIAKSYRTALLEDTKLKEMFYKRQLQSLRMDDIKSELQGDINDFGFSFSNSVENEYFNIQRNCKLTLSEKKIYNFYSERKVSIKEQKYFVGKYNMNEVNQYDLNLMVDVFLLDCRIHNIPVKKSKVVTSFESLEGDILGLSYGLNDDNLIELKIDPIKWEASSVPKRWYLIYHELGHDVLNFKHGNGGKMMFNFADRGYSWNEFLEDKNYMLDSYKTK